jgi:hypothetical protein
MGKRAIVLTAVVAIVTELAAGAYLWVQATYVLPAASCGQWAMAGQLPGAPGAAQCFTAAARTCAAAGIRVHWQGAETATDHVYVIRAGGTPGRCQVTDYSQLRWLTPGRVETAACNASVTSAGVALSCHSVVTIMITPAQQLVQ